MNSYQFPQQNVLCDEKPFSRELLQSLLEKVYTRSPPFTGYLKSEGVELSVHFLFFFNGLPYAAGKYEDIKPISYSIQEFGRYIASSADKFMYVTLCETDPVLMNNMLHFLQHEPDVKAPTSLIDLDYIIRQIGEAGKNAMIALCRDNKFNFFYFSEGKGTHAHYSDLTFNRPEGMSIDDELQLYAFYKPEDKVQAFIFRDMIPTKENEEQLDKESLYKLLTVGYLKDRRKKGREIPPERAVKPDSINTMVSSVPAVGGGVAALVNALHQKPKLPSVVLTVESGPLQGERFTVTLPCSIGRKNCDLILDDRHISRRHAELKIIENKLVIEDLASKNGTKVNGEAVTSKRLSQNDLITIGPTTLRISPV